MFKLFSKKHKEAPLPETERQKYTFLHRWFDGHIPRWRELLGHLSDQRVRLLEIGAFEGGSTTFILDELCSHPESHLLSIDTFEGSPITRKCEQTKSILPILEERFVENVRRTGRSEQHTYRKGTSFDILCDLNCEGGEPFDFIYIDGSHRTFDVLSDGVLAWPLLSPNGILLFDDYQLGDPGSSRHPKTAIDAFISCVGAEAEILDRTLQVAIRKR